MSTVILAEKPSQALAYASALKQSTKKDGYFEIKDPIFADETFITFGFGHLVELAEPGHYEEKWQNWKLESLPIFPERYDFEVAKDKGKQFKIVAKLLKQANTIIVATDSDREGENIAWSIIHKANAFSKDKTYKRLWINSLEKDVIRSGFQNLQPGMNYYPFYQEAQTRQIADWLIGMNASPLYTLNLQQKGVQGTFSLGRVQTPTLYLIYQRQEAIENFKKEPFFEIEADITVKQGSFKGNLSSSERFKTQEELLSFVSSKHAKIGNQEGRIADVQTKEKKTNSPSLFSLSSLQSKVNQLYKATASQTLKAMQGLYEAKLLSYPRTDTPFITENEFAYLKANFGTYSGFLGLDLEMVKTLYSILHRSLDLTEFMEEVLIDDNMVFDIDNLKGFLNDTSSFGFIAKENNKIIGFAYCYTLLRPDGKTMFYLHSIGMLPNYQDKGYGSKLLSFIKEYSKEIGCSEMFLITDKGNPRACHVYEKLGGKNDYKDEIVYVYDYEKGDK